MVQILLLRPQSTVSNREFPRGNKGAIRIPFLSFQYLRRPGCTAKLLCLHIAGGFDPYRLIRYPSFFPGGQILNVNE